MLDLKFLSPIHLTYKKPLFLFGEKVLGRKVFPIAVGESKEEISLLAGVHPKVSVKKLIDHKSPYLKLAYDLAKLKNNHPLLKNDFLPPTQKTIFPEEIQETLKSNWKNETLKIKLKGKENLEEKLQSLTSFCKKFPGVKLRIDFGRELSANDFNWAQKKSQGLPIEYIEDPLSLKELVAFDRSSNDLPLCLDSLALYFENDKKLLNERNLSILCPDIDSLFQKISAFTIKPSLFSRFNDLSGIIERAKSANPKIKLIWSHTFEGPYRMESTWYLYFYFLKKYPQDTAIAQAINSEDFIQTFCEEKK